MAAIVDAAAKKGKKGGDALEVPRFGNCYTTIVIYR
jgi:hypothetical protein